MRLRSLEIQGFKSFPDKTRLTFNDGITAVVGPNGSGKSNIADAVRWVLGEQSTKTLRGGKMEDVIFGGTQTRRAQGYAQVQLTIDNTDGVLGESPQVTVSRKLYRSGESEYRINSATVRLKDVYELFMDTGLGRDGYSIIGQGRIAEIVSAKSTQRREIFEEAAGISKYRYRKAEAQRRLAAAEENLLRLKDILVELESRVEPLRIQSEKAMQFLHYAEEKKSLEISLWVSTLEQSKAVLREQEDKILLCKTSHDEIQSELDGIESQINGLFAKMQTAAIEIDQCRTQMRQAEEKSLQIAAKIAVLENDIAHNNSSAVRLTEELAQSDASEEALGEQISLFEIQRTEKEQALSRIQEVQADLQEQIAQTRAEQEQVSNRIDALKERRFGLTQSINEVKLSAASSGSLIDETIERLESLKANVEMRNSNLQQLKHEISDCAGLLEHIEETIASLQNAKQGWMLKQESRRQKCVELETKKRDFEDQVRQKMQKAKLLSDLEKSMEGFQHSVKYVMGEAEKGTLKDIYGPVSRLISVAEEHALAIEIALGGAMQNIVVKDEKAAKHAIRSLKEARAGRVTFLPITTVKGEKRLEEPWISSVEGFVGVADELVGYDPQFAGIIHQLLGRILIVQDLDCALLAAKRGDYHFRVVTLDGQMVNAGGSMTGGYVAKSVGILSRSKEIEALKAQADALAQEARQIEGDQKTAQEELAAVQAKISGIQGELATAQEDKIRYSAELKQLHAAHELALKTQETSAKEYDQLEARLEELRQKDLSNAGLTAELNSQLAQVAAELAQLSEEREDRTQSVAALSEQLSQGNLQAVTLKNESETLFQMSEQLRRQKSRQKEHEEDLRRQISALEHQNQMIVQQIAQAKIQREDFAKQTSGLSAKIEQLTAVRNQAEAQTTALRSSEKQVTARRETAVRELARLEEKRNALQVDYDSIIARLWDEYEMTRSQAIEAAQPISDTNQAQRQLSELKGKIKALGSVNVGAVEEYKEVFERYSFLREQTNDAEKSRKELLRLIDGLTSDMQVIFAENFQKIGTHFSRIFTELFGGGNAQLTLADPVDVLESGVEIYVQPPGKIIKNLAALSGGEQAFVAIAIYFAILKVRPSPFCLLDEIEAALDDVNVVKYAQYLRTLCGKTQFIAITHRRGTMEEADILYGVTMQEEGVSKLLELNVGEIESKLGIK